MISSNLTFEKSLSIFITPDQKRIIPKEGILGANLIIKFDIVFPTKIKNKEKLRKLLS